MLFCGREALLPAEPFRGIPAVGRVAQLIRPKLAIHLNHKLAVEVVALKICFAAHAGRVVEALLRQVLLADHERDVAGGVRCVLVDNAGDVVRRDPVDLGAGTS